MSITLSWEGGTLAAFQAADVAVFSCRERNLPAYVTPMLAIEVVIR